MVSMKFVTYRLELHYHLTTFSSACRGGVKYVRREVPEHFVFDYKNTDWALFRRKIDSRMDLNFSLDIVESWADVDSMIWSFTEARAVAVPLVCPSRFVLHPPRKVYYSPEKWLVAYVAEQL
jgi:hypothetical protein